MTEIDTVMQYTEEYSSLGGVSAIRMMTVYLPISKEEAELKKFSFTSSADTPSLRVFLSLASMLTYLRQNGKEIKHYACIRGFYGDDPLTLVKNEKYGIYFGVTLPPINADGYFLTCNLAVSLDEIYDVPYDFVNSQNTYQGIKGKQSIFHIIQNHFINDLDKFTALGLTSLVLRDVIPATYDLQFIVDTDIFWKLITSMNFIIENQGGVRLAKRFDLTIYDRNSLQNASWFSSVSEDIRYHSDPLKADRMSIRTTTLDVDRLFLADPVNRETLQMHSFKKLVELIEVYAINSKKSVKGDSTIVPQSSGGEASVAMEGLTSGSTNIIKSKREKILNFIVTLMNKLDPSGDNGKFYKEFLTKMSDKEFTQFMKYLREKKYRLHITMPNMIKTFRMSDILDAAKFLKHEFMHRLWIPDTATGTKFLTNEKHMILKLPIRRAQQELDKKCSVPESDTRIDALTGQVTGPDRACSISTTEMRALNTRGGLSAVMNEIVNIRGGNITAYGDFKRQLEETGNVDLSMLDPSSKTRSSVISSVFFKAMMLENNLAEANTSPSMEGLFDLSSKVNSGRIYTTIKHFPVKWFERKLLKEYGSIKVTRFYESFGIFWYHDSVKLHNFFIPEIYFLLKKFRAPSKLLDNIAENTWISDLVKSNGPIPENIRNISKTMNVTLYPHQEEFIKIYSSKKQLCHLNGEILSFDQGLGKTITSLALMEHLDKKTIIIIAPKSTLQTVWEDHLKRFYNVSQNYYIYGKSGQPAPTKDTRFYVVNYENIHKLKEYYPIMHKGDALSIIVDECHNFLRMKSNRTQEMITIREELRCSDILLMSGTPVKAMGVEMIPLLRTIDGYFDEKAEMIFKSSFGLNTNIAGDILHARMSMMMYRKLKEEVLKLPEKKEWTIPVVLSNGSDYTLTSIKKEVVKFVTTRTKYHESRKQLYTKQFQDIVTALRSLVPDLKEFERWVALCERFNKTGYNVFSEEDRRNAVWANVYEKNVLLSLMTKEIRQKYNTCISAYKYVRLKIQGEVIGQLLIQLRSRMTSDILRSIDLSQLIDEAAKKTIFFTSYVDTVEVSEKRLQDLGYHPLLVYGKTKDVASALHKFKVDESANPLIATIQTLATGVTLTEASRCIFLNQPYRDSDYRQASDRIHRIGQDTDVDIIKLLLDTGDEPNLSTRMEDILNWSKTLSGAIVDGDIIAHLVSMESLDDLKISFEDLVLD